MVDVFSNRIPILFDSGSIPDVMSVELYKKLHVLPRPTKGLIIVVDENEAVVVGEVLGVPVTVGTVTTELASLVVRNAPFAMVVWRPSMKKMKASLDFYKDIATFRCE